MASSHFAGQQRKDLSIDMIRTKIAHGKSLSQKANRHKEYEQKRHFGLKDVNIPTLEGRNLELDEMSEELIPEKISVKPRSLKSLLSDQRRQMLQKYKEEKQLKKLKEDREKAERGVFKVGLYRPDKPYFLLSIPQYQSKKVGHGSDVRAAQSGQRQTSEKKVDGERKAGQAAAPASARVTRSTTAAAKRPGAASPSCAGAAAAATRDSGTERKAANQGRPAKKIEKKPGKVVSFKADSEENTLESQTSETSGMDKNGVLSKKEKLPKTNTAKMKGRQSFAPEDFVFHPPDGLKTYRLTPVTPRSTNSLTPRYTWSPLKTEIDKTQEATKEVLARKCETSSARTVHQDSSKLQCPLGSLTAGDTEYILNRNETTTKNVDGLPIKEVPSLEVNEDQKSQSQHNVLYFRNILRSETEELTSHCLEWERKLELDIPDEAKGLIRIAVGQTRLLMKERFKQFEGLVDDCEYKRSEKDTTCADLDGFWDMVRFQIQDIHQKFNNLTKLEVCGWENDNNTSKKVFQKQVVSGLASKPKQDDGGRMAARNRLAAAKKAMRERGQRKEQAEAAASAAPKEVDQIVFDGGFFRIESPVKSFSVFDNKNLTTERHLLDSPRLKCSNPSTQVERRQQERARHISFAGDLIAFSP
ncbi:disks large-associated protein 5 isoform X2 [Diceros bicornis minor]|uniref:disks large-associated protein 5 isoform X2 n=1 Tax=Diceros bicornis minor TaxID=77932 RepID=UPI0026F10391|nr:disks large-associated protein 5 isoform X2 [Diceros bicornis minor]